MNSSGPTSNRDYWLGRARGVSRQVNLAWWLETLAAPLLIASIPAAAALLMLRREFPEMDPWRIAIAGGAAVSLLILGCRALAARKFELPAASLVRIEAAMRLRNSLSAAAAGVAPWPEPAGPVNAGLRWQWPRLLVPPLGALLLVAAGLLIPISQNNQPIQPTEQPQAWKQLTTELEALTKDELVDEKYLEDTRKRLDELKSQQEDQWFSHSSLEATDSLKKSHRAETQRLERDLDRAGNALETVEKNAGGLNQAEKNRLAQEFDQAMQGLADGAMKPNAALLEQLKQLDLKDLGKLSPEQLQQLRASLKKSAQAMKQAQGKGEDWSDELLDGQGEGEGEGNGDGEGEGEGNGHGGVNRGPGHVPGVLGREKDSLETGALTGLQAKDLSKSTPGDLLELQDAEHDVDKTPSRVTEGGNTDATGKGGDRVWKDSLDPDEQRVLKRFFE